MSVTTQHPQYIENIEDWETVTDSIKESRIKDKDVTYLPRTSGQTEYLNKTNDDSPYQNYMRRARFPGIVNPALTALTGIAHLKPPVIELPARLQYVETDITPNGGGLDELSRVCVRKDLQHGRYGLLSDVDGDGQANIAGYTAESIINWKTQIIDGRQITSLVVLKESQDISEDIFSHKEMPVYRVLRLDEGRYVSELYNEKSERIDEAIAQTPAGRPLDYIPFTFIGSIDLTPDVDESPLLPLAKAAISIYQLDADYRQSLHMTSQPTPVVAGAGSNPPTMIGSATMWVLPENAEWGYLEVAGVGLEAQRQEIMDEYERAMKIGGELVNKNSAESGEALRLKLFNRHANLYSVVNNVGAGIEQALKYCADLTGVTGDIVYQANNDFTGDEVNEQLINAMNAAINAGNIPREFLYEVIRRAGLTEMTDDEINASIEFNQ